MSSPFIANILQITVKNCHLKLYHELGPEMYKQTNKQANMIHMLRSILFIRVYSVLSSVDTKITLLQKYPVRLNKTTPLQNEISSCNFYFVSIGI